MKFAAVLAFFLLGLTLVFANGTVTTNNAVIGVVGAAAPTTVSASTVAITDVDVSKNIDITATKTNGLQYAQPTLMTTLVPTVVPTMLPTVTPVAFIDYDYSAASGLTPFSYF